MNEWMIRISNESQISSIRQNWMNRFPLDTGMTRINNNIVIDIYGIISSLSNDNNSQYLISFPLNTHAFLYFLLSFTAYWIQYQIEVSLLWQWILAFTEYLFHWILLVKEFDTILITGWASVSLFLLSISSLNIIWIIFKSNNEYHTQYQSVSHRPMASSPGIPSQFQNIITFCIE